MNPTANPTQAGRPYTEEMRQVLERAQQGDRSVLPRLRELLDERPELWREAGDLAAHAREAMLNLAAGGSLLLREAVARKMAELEGELAGPQPSPVERLLAGRAALCWAQAHLADLDALQKGRAGGAQDAQAQRRQNAAQARYLAALKQLVLVRKLLTPPVAPIAVATRLAGNGQRAPFRRQGIASPALGVGVEN